MIKVLSFEIPKSEKAPYLQLADGLRLAIQKGQIKAGESLPSSRDLSKSVGLHRHTVMAGLEELVAEGWITAVERKGYQVCNTLPSHFFEPLKLNTKSRPKARFEWKLPGRPELGPLFQLNPDIKFNFKSGIPDLREFPFQEFKSHLVDSLKRSGPRVLSYGSPLGYEPLIGELKVYLRRVRALKAENVIITHGSQEAIFIAAQLLLKPGDRVAVEELGYQPALAALKSAGAIPIPIRLDKEGIDPVSFEQAAKKYKLKLLYTTSLHQYPTTVTLPVARRLRIYEIAAEHGVPILEDDYDHEFHYRSQPIAPIASHDPEGIVIYISTLSKVFSPSARIGFMSVPQALVEPISDYRRIVTRQNDLLMQDALCRWMRDGGFERHLRRMRRLYEERRNGLVEYLSEAKESGTRLSWNTPDGGMAVWVDIHKDSSVIARRASMEGVYVACEADFQIRAASGSCLRIGFANQSPKEIRQGMDILFGTWGKRKSKPF